MVGRRAGDLATRWQAVKIEQINPRRVSRFTITIPFSLAETSLSEFASMFAAQEIVHA
jgi:hypothetical protein